MKQELRTKVEKFIKEHYKGNDSFPDPMLVVELQNGNVFCLPTTPTFNILKRQHPLEKLDQYDLLYNVIRKLVKGSMEMFDSKIKNLTLVTEAKQKDEYGNCFIVYVNSSRNLKINGNGIAQIRNKQIFGFTSPGIIAGRMTDLLLLGFKDGMSEEVQKKGA